MNMRMMLLIYALRIRRQNVVFIHVFNEIHEIHISKLDDGTMNKYNEPE